MARPESPRLWTQLNRWRHKPTPHAVLHPCQVVGGPTPVGNSHTILPLALTSDCMATATGARRGGIIHLRVRARVHAFPIGTGRSVA
jgi:hypothetical protein